MNSKLLRFSLFSLGLLSVCFAYENITGEVLEDLFFYDGVTLSGVTTPSNPEAATGTTTVDLEGTGSITVGSRGDGGMLRLIVWGGTRISSTREYEEGSPSNAWWDGTLKAPIYSRAIPVEEMSFSSNSNHIDSEIVLLKTYGLGGANETFSFSPAATIVLPVSVPDFTKVWFVVKDGGGNIGSIGENDYCIVQSELCVIDIDSANEIALVRERFDDCPKMTVTNGSLGTEPYCEIKCNRGFVPDISLTECVTPDDENAIQVFAPVEEEVGGDTEEGTVGFLAGPARQGYLRYTGSDEQLTARDVEGLTGLDLQYVLRHNASLNYRTSEPEEESGFSLASLSKTMNDLRSKIWVWENPIEPEGGTAVALGEAVGGGDSVADNTGEEGTMHASGPLLPSTGPVGVFAGLAAFGLGLMAFARRK